MNWFNKTRFIQIRKKEANRQHIGYLLLFFIVWPFGAMISAFKHFRMPGSKWITWLFFVFFGFVFVFSQQVEGGADSARYAESLRALNSNWIGFNGFKQLLYSEDTNYVDIYQPLVTWIVAYFTPNPHWLFMVFAAVFGWFYVQNIWMILDRIYQKKKIDLVLFLFILAFVLVNPIWNINGVRMWTAAQVFIYGLLRFILEKDKKGMIWMFLSLFFHFSFFIPLAVFIIYQFVPKNSSLWLAFFLLTSFVRELDLAVVRDFLSFLPDFLQARVAGYTKEEYLERLLESNAKKTWHVQFSEMFARYILYGWALIVYFKGGDWLKKNPSYHNLFVFALFFGGIAQVLSNVPSGGRFMTPVSICLYAVFVLFLAELKQDNSVKVFKLITIPFILFVMIFWIRIGFDFIGISTFISNPIVALFLEDELPLIDFIKSIF